MNLRTLERRIVVGTRFLSLFAVLGSLAGSLLMFLLGSYNIYEAYAYGLQLDEGATTTYGTAAVISVIEGLDRFLIGIVLLYFAYGVYALLIHPDQGERDLALPDWLQIRQIGQLKQVVAEVIVVILLVLFLRVALEAYNTPGAELTWMQIASLAVLPVSIALLALALRLVELHPKETAEERDEEAMIQARTDADPE